MNTGRKSNKSITVRKWSFLTEEILIFSYEKQTLKRVDGENVFVRVE